MKIQLPTNEIETYDILAVFPFKSSTKRMGILLRNLETNRIIFYLKAADSVMLNRVKAYS